VLGEKRFMHKKHQHAGHTSKGLFDPQRLFALLGLKGEETILDLGCGDGYLSLLIAQIEQKGRVYALDIYKEGVKLFKASLKKLTNALPVLADAHKVPFKKETIDIVLMVDVVHGFYVNEELETIIKEIAFTLKPQGKIAIVDFPPNPEIPGPPLDIRLSPEKIRKIFSPFGFRQEIVVELSPSQYVVILEKMRIN